MPRSRSGPHRLTPVGLSPGALGLVLAWTGGAAIARLTGATPVVIMLAGGLVWFVAAFVAGCVALRGVTVDGVVTPALVTAGEEFPIRVDVSTRVPVWIDVHAGGDVIASGWAWPGGFDGTAAVERRGSVDSLQVRVRSAGVTGTVWWRRKVTVPIGELVVAPRPSAAQAQVQRPSLNIGGDFAGRAGAIAGEIDGVRPWREGDGDKSVHWASSLRSGELVVHDHRHDAERRVIVRARSGMPDPDDEAGRARWALEQGLRAGADVVAAIDDGEPAPIPDAAAAARWTALADLGERAVSGSRPPRGDIEPETTARPSARWWSAGATLLALITLNGALGYGPAITLVVSAVVAVSAWVSARSLATGAPVPATVRVVVGLGALFGFVVVAAGVRPLAGLLSMLRGPLPQVLVILVLLHGFECRDRRTIRVGLGISGVVLAYASGFRVDDRIGWWLAAWAFCFGMATSRLALPTTAPVNAPANDATTGAARRMARRWTPTAAGIGLGLVGTFVVLALVPIPDGPARLTLPTFIEDVREVGSPGAIAAPDGEVRDSDDAGDGSRAPAGQPGGYTGFAQSMDTSVRGRLSDEVVMRVRAPQPDFWRGQTFDTFDGRRWYADEDVGNLRAGPNIDVPRALGDTADPDTVAVDRFVQTFYVEQDMPNVIFAAYRPVQAIVDADVWTRHDGAMRASTVLTEGSVYTVVSERVRVTEQLLRDQRLVGERLSRFGRQVLARYLTVPETTTPETIALANRLAAGAKSTYDVVRAYEQWLARNVEYDLDAPLPDEGEDAVHDFLFDSRRGFCEQIASALAIMLRTQGVPTRVATGYAAGVRDRIAGVFEVRASDAHAWVEVWFPETGWQAFDPTASVPLAGEAEVDTIGSELITGFIDYIDRHTMEVVLVVASIAAVVVVVVLVRELRRRRLRGRWGLLQDRFGALAAERGAPPGTTNARRAAQWTAADDAEVAKLVARQLDRAAFDPDFDDDDGEYEHTRKLVGSLRNPRR